MPQLRHFPRRSLQLSHLSSRPRSSLISSRPPPSSPSRNSSQSSASASSFSSRTTTITSPPFPQHHSRFPTLASLLFAAAMSTSGDTASNPNPNQTNITPLPRASYPAQITFSPHDFLRADETSDGTFYAQARFVQHIDDGAVEALKGYYAAVLQVPESPERAMRVVDLCSSWTSHLPENLRGRMASCVGYGLNAREMAANAHLTGFWVRDFNARVRGGGVGMDRGEGDGRGDGGGDERLLREIADGTIDVVICNVSVDYLVEPLKVLAEVWRCLKVGGTAHMAFSNRCFPTKVIGRWLKMDDAERRRWVGGYFWAVGGFEDVEEVVLREGRGWNKDPLFVVRARKGVRVEAEAV